MIMSPPSQSYQPDPTRRALFRVLAWGSLLSPLASFAPGLLASCATAPEPRVELAGSCESDYAGQRALLKGEGEFAQYLPAAKLYYAMLASCKPVIAGKFTPADLTRGGLVVGNRTTFASDLGHTTQPGSYQVERIDPPGEDTLVIETGGLRVTTYQGGINMPDSMIKTEFTYRLFPAAVNGIVGEGEPVFLTSSNEVEGWYLNSRGQLRGFQPYLADQSRDFLPEFIGDFLIPSLLEGIVQAELRK